MIPDAPAFDHTEPDGTRLVIMTDADAVSFYYGSKTITSFSLTAGSAARLAWFLLWTYWVRWAKLGWRARQTRRALQRRLKIQAIREV